MIIRVKHRQSQYDPYITTDIDLNYYNPYVKYTKYSNVIYGISIYRNVRKDRFKKGQPITTLMLVDDTEVKIIDGNKVTKVSGLLNLFALANFIG
jgi:hypothetical protein